MITLMGFPSLPYYWLSSQKHKGLFCASPACVWQCMRVCWCACVFSRLCLHCLGYIVSRCTAEKRACLHLYKQMLHAVSSSARETTANYPADGLPARFQPYSAQTQKWTNSSVCVCVCVCAQFMLCQNACVTLYCLTFLFILSK